MKALRLNAWKSDPVLEEVSMPELDAGEVSVQTTYWGNRWELVEVLDLASRGLLTAEVSLYTLDDAATGYRDLAHGTVNGRAVVVPTDSYRP